MTIAAPLASSALSARALVTRLGEWRGDGPVYEALAERVRLLLIDGRIAAGVKLPAERELAEHLGLSRTSIVSAYRTLRESGYLHSVQGSGSVTRLPAPTVAMEGHAFAQPVTPHGMTTLDGNPTGALDFGMACPPAFAGLGEYYRRAVDELPSILPGKGFDLWGLPETRQAIAERYTARGLPTSADQIMITLGAQHAISLVARSILARGDRALVESPTYPHAYEILRSAGARLVTVPVRPEGWDAEEIEQVLLAARPALAYLMPDFHNPTGQSMDAATRRSTVEAAVRAGTTLVIDETTAELDIDRPYIAPPFATHAQDSAEHRASVITIGSVGKSVWGGMRLGWVRAEPATIRTLLARRPLYDYGTPQLEQLALRHLMGDMDSILEMRRQSLRESRDAMESALAASLPEWTVPHAHGGICTWVSLGRPVSSALTLAARGNGLAVTAGPRFGIDGAFERYLRIPFTSSVDQVERGIAVLEQSWRQLSARSFVDAGYLDQVV